MDLSDNQRREKELIAEWMKKSKVAGDTMWLKANSWSGLGDFTSADYGEEPKH